MPNQVINNVPGFEGDAPSKNPADQEVKKVSTDEVEEEKETPEESSTLETPAEEVVDESTDGEDNSDQEELSKQVQGLTEEREKLLREIQELRGTRREIKQEEIKKVDAQLDELKDLQPEDVGLIERILKAKGYVSKEDVKQQLYEEVKQQELNKFLDKYPEFKPENDKNDINWNSLQREIGYLRLPSDPHQIPEVLERARRLMTRVGVERNDQIQKQKIKSASMGSGGVSRSSSSKSFTLLQRDQLSRGGFTEEEIKEMESSL